MDWIADWLSAGGIDSLWLLLALGAIIDLALVLCAWLVKRYIAGR